MNGWRERLIRLACALGAGAALFALTFFLLAPEGSRRGEAMEDRRGTAAPTTLLLPSPAPAVSAPVDGEEAGNEAAYWGNRNSRVFHAPGCSSLSRTEESNRVPFADRQAALDAGYTPCGRCNP